ncbi:hypothetical protein LMG28138_01170 [Pararobbsia alpina]|uniref:Addiction module killer protein n=1 Tax=Pararobbsia alpina TaxID=621374 RepID=A0A6S7B8Y7_9BURK|nr:hypothetical protein LMG28138_01170 [Pararobbsia alpina]
MLLTIRDFLVNRLIETEVFADWLNGLKDLSARGFIVGRLNRAINGNFGDHHDVGDGVWEMRIDKGPGYRVHYAREGRVVYVILCGGDKSTQKADIKRAKAIWTEIKEQS